MQCISCGAEIPDGEERCASCVATAAGASSADAATRAGEVSPAALGAVDLLGAGTVIADRFEVVRVLGQGGMGAVYECRDRQLNRQVAMKQLLPRLANSASSVQRLETEAKAVASVSHQNVIQVFDFINDPAGKFIVMEFIDGETLSSRLDRIGRLSMRETLRVMLQVGMAIDAAHRKGIIHRDIKPANIMITAEGLPKLGDFGIAQLFGKQDVTTTGTAMGTWVYASPEQLTDAKHVDRRSDIYSLGATLYEMLTGETPRHISDDHVPRLMLPLVKKCLAKAPDDRYQSAPELLKALTDVFKAYQALQQPAGPEAPAPETAQSGAARADAAPTPTPEPGDGQPRRRRRSTLWRARGVPWSCPIRTGLGIAVVVWTVMNRGNVDSIIGGLLDQILPSGSVGADIVSYLGRIPYEKVGLALGAGLIIIPILNRVSTEFRLSATRLVVRTGILFKKEHDFPLADIQDVHISQGLFGRILGYGTVDLTSGIGESILLEGVPRPSSLRNNIIAARDE